MLKKAENKSRADQEDRSLTGRLAVRILKLAVIPVVAFALFYGVLIARWYSGEVVIQRDYVGELVGRSVAEAGPSPAWPAIAGVFGGLDPEGAGLVSEPVHPESRHWGDWMAYAEQHRADVESLRAALDRDRLGYLASVVRRDNGGWIYDDPDEGPTSVATNMDLVVPLMMVGGTSRWVPRLLMLDAWRSIANDETHVAVENIIAAIRYPSQSSESSLLISDLMAIGTYSMVIQDALRLLEANPDVFSASDLRRIRGAVLAFMGGDIGFRLDDERLLFSETAQRIFTDNGSGDGHSVVCYAQYEMFEFEPSELQRGFSFIGPLWLLIAPSRREFEAMTDRCFDAIRADTLALPYENRQSEIDLLKAEFRQSWQNQQRWALHEMLLSEIFVSFDNVIDNSRMVQSSAAAVFALHEYRLDHGGWPKALALLIPEYLDELPLDSFSGQLLRYRLDDSGSPLLYSVWRDGDDDMGADFDVNADPWSRATPDGDLVFWPPAPVIDDEYEDEYEDDYDYEDEH